LELVDRPDASRCGQPTTQQIGLSIVWSDDQNIIAHDAVDSTFLVHETLSQQILIGSLDLLSLLRARLTVSFVSDIAEHQARSAEKPMSRIEQEFLLAGVGAFDSRAS
jgi:hypothetical protein